METNVTLYPTDFVYLDENKQMKTFTNNKQIIITSDEYEISEARKNGFNLVSCTELSKEQQEVLKENILKFS